MIGHAENSRATTLACGWLRKNKAALVLRMPGLGESAHRVELLFDIKTIKVIKYFKRTNLLGDYFLIEAKFLSFLETIHELQFCS